MENAKIAGTATINRFPSSATWPMDAKWPRLSGWQRSRQALVAAVVVAEQQRSSLLGGYGRLLSTINGGNG